MQKIVFLDADTLGKVDNLKYIERQGKLTLHQHTEAEEVVERCLNQKIVIVNKVEMTAAVMSRLPELKLICVAATGINNVDLNYTKKNGIEVMNVAGYSNDSV